MEQFLTHFGYWGIFLVLMASAVGLPIPEDIPLIFGGYLCASEYASLYIMVPFTFGTVLGSDLLLYMVGRRYGRHVPNLPLFRRFLTPQRLAAAEMAFHKHGGKTLFTSRFLPGVRAAVFFTAGVFKIPAWKFILFDGAAALLSVPTLVLAGYYFSAHLDVVKEAAFTTQLILASIAVCVVAGVIWYKRRRRKVAAAAVDSHPGLHAAQAVSSPATPSGEHHTSESKKSTPQSIIKAFTPPPSTSKPQT